MRSKSVPEANLSISFRLGLCERRTSFDINILYTYSITAYDITIKIKRKPALSQNNALHIK
jgi:hypothetical protein